MIAENKQSKYVLPAWLHGAWGMIGLGAILYVLAFVAWTFFHWGGDANMALISDLAYLPVSFFATLAAWRIALTKQFSPRLRLAWCFLGLAAFSTFLADLIWFYLEIILQAPAFPSAADIFYLSYYVFVMAGLLLFPAARFRQGELVKFILDMAIVLLAAWMAIWFFLVYPLGVETGSDFLILALSAAYPIGDLLLLGGMLALLFRRPDPTTRHVLVILLGSFLMSLAGDLLYSYQSIQETYISGSWVDATWILGYLLLGLAALRQALPVQNEIADQRMTRLLTQLSNNLPFLGIIFGYAIMLYAAVNTAFAIPMRGLFVSSFLLTILVIVRQWLVLHENHLLTERLSQTAEQLRLVSQQHESRASELSQDLLMAAELVRQITRVQDLEAMLYWAVELICARYDLYYVQVYLMDASGRNLVLRSGSGKVGAELVQRKHSLPLNQASINSSAVLEKKPIIVEDATNSPIFRHNPLLPETRSEIALPMVVLDRVLGVLDLQSDQPSRWTRDNLAVFEAIAGQLAIAIENAELLAEAERARLRVESQARRLEQKGWGDYLNAIDSPERLGYAYDQGIVSPLAAPLPLAPTQDVLEASISVAGLAVGKFQLERQEVWDAGEVELVKAFSQQVAQQIENLRLLEQSERYRLEAEQVARRLTREGWQAYFTSAEAPEIGFAYDLNQVKPMATSGNHRLPPAVEQDLVVQGVAIGKIELSGVDQQDTHTIEITTAVAEQLSAHLENLHLLEETRRSEEELVKFRMGLDKSVDAVFITDISGKILYINPAFTQIYGYSEEETLGNTPRILKSGLIPQERYQHFWAALLGKQVVAGEIVNKAKDGRMIPIEGANNAITDEQGNIIGFLAVHRDITERKRAQETMAKRAAELDTVARISTQVSSLQEPQQILQTVVDLAKTDFALYHAHIYLMDEHSENLALAAGAGEVGQQMTAQGWQIPLSRERSLVARAARTRQGIIVNDVRAEPDFMPNPLLPETRAEMAIPLIAGEKVLGVVDVQSEQVDHFTQEDVNIQTALASQIAISLQNARQHHETQVALSKTETLYAITRSATRSLDLDEVLREMLNKTLSATGLEAGLISIVDASTERLYLAVHHNLPEPLVRKLSTVGLDGTLCDMVYRKEATISLQDMSSDAPLDVTGLLKLGLLSYQGVPLVAKGKVLGTLCAFGFSPRADLHETVELMEIAGQQIGIAIENAQLFQQIQRQAEHEARINAISQKIQTTTSVEDALQVAIRELGRALNAQKTVVQLGVAGYEIAPPKPNGSRSNGN